MAGILSEVANIIESEAQASAVFQKGFLGILSLVARLSTKPLVGFFTCGFEGERWKLLRESLAPAIEEAGTLLGQQDKLQQLVKGGFPAVLGTVLGVISHPIGVLLSEGLRDPELAGAIAGSVRAAGSKLSEPGFLDKLKSAGLRGVLIEVARIAKKPILLALAKVIGDDDFKVALDASYDKVLSGLTPEALATDGLLGMVRKVAPEWIRLILVKGSEWLKQKLPELKERLEQTADAVANLGGALPQEQTVLASFGGALREVVKSATAAGMPRFAQSWAECARTLPTDDLVPQVKAAAACLGTAVKAVFTAGGDAKAEAPEATGEAASLPTPEETAASEDTPPEAAAEGEAPQQTPAEQLAALTERYTAAHAAAAREHQAGASASALLHSGASLLPAPARAAAQDAATRHRKALDDAQLVVTLVRTLQSRATAKLGAEAKSGDVETALAAEGTFAVAVEGAPEGPTALVAPFERARAALTKLALLGERYLRAATLVLAQKHQTIVTRATQTFAKRLAEAKAALEAFQETVAPKAEAPAEAPAEEESAQDTPPEE